MYYTVFTPDTRYEIKDMREIINGNKPENPWSFMGRSGEANPFGKIPIVEFNRATDRMGCFERQISDMNALNVEVSDFANSVAQTTQEVFLVQDSTCRKIVMVKLSLLLEGNGLSHRRVGMVERQC